MKKMLILLPLLFLLVFPQAQYAEDSSMSATVSPTPMQVNYNLPYPGILPDNPLYVLKVFRDRLISFFISDPLKKSAFELLQADKRLQAAFYLEKKDLSIGRQGSKEDELVGSTLSKGENYFEESLTSIKAAKQMGEDVNPQITRLQSAAVKHMLVIEDMQLSASPALQKVLSQQRRRLESFEKMVSALAKN
jgi:hypothetical protein